MTTRQPISVPLDRIITRTVRVDTGMRDDFNQPIFRDETFDVWAGRLDFQGRDQLTIASFGVIGLLDTRFYVRDDLVNPWKTGQTFTSEGLTFTVRGVSEVVRGRTLELLARAAGA